jgi:hypothetical protein
VIEAMRLTAPELTEEEARRALEEMGLWGWRGGRGMWTLRVRLRHCQRRSRRFRWAPAEGDVGAGVCVASRHDHDG